MSTRKSISAELVQEGRASFDTTDDQRLTLHPGRVRCNFGFVRASPRSVRIEEDEVLSWLELTDRGGDVFRAERSIPANLFLELIRLGQPVHVTSDVEEMLSGIRCWHDRRRYIPTVATDEDGRAKPLVYFAEGLAPRIDLLSNGRSLLVRIEATQGGGIGGVPTPQVTIRTFWGPRVILWPSLLSDAVDPHVGPAVFSKVGTHGEPQVTVTLA